MVLPVMIAFWAAIVWFAQAVIVSIELAHAARHGVFWMAYHDAEYGESEEIRRVEDLCAHFLRRQAPLLDVRRVRIAVQPGDRWQPVGPRTLFDIPGLLKLAARIDETLKSAAGLTRFRPASVTVEYDLKAPRLLRAIPGFPDSIPLRGYSVCYR